MARSPHPSPLPPGGRGWPPAGGRVRGHFPRASARARRVERDHGLHPFGPPGLRKVARRRGASRCALVGRFSNRPYNASRRRVPRRDGRAVRPLADWKASVALLLSFADINERCLRHPRVRRSTPFGVGNRNKWDAPGPWANAHGYSRSTPSGWRENGPHSDRDDEGVQYE